jgi:hypothetical protein
MEFDKDTIIDFLKGLGRHDDAAKASEELPDKVDDQKDADLLSKFGINPSELLSKLPGGLGDKIEDKLGGLLGGLGGKHDN